MRSATLLLFLLPLAACAAGAPGISGGELRAIDINGAPIVGERPLTLRLESGRASGSAGCNSFSGSYRSNGRGELKFGPLEVTRMACDAGLMEQEARYLSILDSAESFNRYGGGGVSVIAPDGRAIRFRPAR
ncbi:MAG TPA: META domain-containing protein [Allosphingosinicella sp.]